MPPYLAGREAEQALIRRFLNGLSKERPYKSDIILYGPRGNGKTALLEWTRHEAAARKLRSLDLYGTGIRSGQDVARRISVRPTWLERLRSVSVGTVGVTLDGLPDGRVSEALLSRVRLGPLLVAVDEAHRLGVEAGAELLNAVQIIQRLGAPVMLILAGTPDLPSHLNAMGASFWDRSEVLPVGRLESTAAADAIRVPLEQRGRSISEDTLDRVVRESHAYPFFLQIWGDLLWNSCPDPSAPISGTDMNRVRSQFERRRDLYYDSRVDELVDAQLFSVAVKVAAEFADSERVLRNRIRIAIRSTLEQEGKASDHDAVTEVGRVLRHLGYVWPVIKQGIRYYEPGIPSLMRFVSQNDAQNRIPRAPA